MPLFPLPPIIVILFLAIAISSQTPDVLAAVGILILISLIYYFLYVRRRDKKEGRSNDE